MKLFNSYVSVDGLKIKFLMHLAAIILFVNFFLASEQTIQPLANWKEIEQKSVHNPDSIHLVLQELKPSVWENGSKTDQMNWLFLEGNYYLSQYQLADAKKNFYQCLDLALNYNNPLFQVNVRSLLGNLFFLEQVHDSALVYFTQAQHYYQKENDFVNLAIINSNIAGVYIALNEPEKAIVILLETVTIYQDLNMEEALGPVYENLALAHAEVGNENQSLNYLTKANRSIKTKWNNNNNFKIHQE